MNKLLTTLGLFLACFTCHACHADTVTFNCSGQCTSTPTVISSSSSTIDVMWEGIEFDGLQAISGATWSGYLDDYLPFPASAIYPVDLTFCIGDSVSKAYVEFSGEIVPEVVDTGIVTITQTAGSTLAPTPTPEPSTGLLVIFGIITLILVDTISSRVRLRRTR